MLGVATGSSPLGTYAELANLVQSGQLDMTGVGAFALDEYVGIASEHPESYYAVIHRTVTEPLGLDPALVHVPNGLAADLDAACRSYERAIADAGGIDLQLLGIGANGHIGFNEPTSSLASRTRPKTLAPQTRDDNARFFESPDQGPMHCLTPVSYTHLDVYKRQVVGQRVVGAVDLADLNERGQQVVAAELVVHVADIEECAGVGEGRRLAVADLCLLYPSRCVYETVPFRAQFVHYCPAAENK